MPFFGCCVPVTSSSAVLVACPDPLVACTVYLPLLASVTVGITSLARPSLNEICTPGRVAAERTWPSRNQFTSGTGKPTEKGRQMERSRHYEMPDIKNYHIYTVVVEHNAIGADICPVPQWQRNLVSERSLKCTEQ